MYYLTTNKNEIEYYKEKSDLLLKKAKPLMEIYRESNIKEYHLFLKKDENIVCDRTRYISSLPLFTISDELLIKYSYFFYTFYIL
jgi:L-rhamnose mutarotase